MKGKIAFVLGAAVGYVLGTRAGRERYEQIKRGAQRLWNTDPVQRGVHIMRDAVDERAEEAKRLTRRFGSQLLGKLSAQAAGKPDSDDASGAQTAPDTGKNAAQKRAPRKTSAEDEE